MANELNLSAVMRYADNGQELDSLDFDLIGQLLTVTGTDHVRGTITASTSAAALDLGSCASCGILVAKNRGSVAVNIRAGSGGTDVLTFPAGIGYWCYLATNTPYAVTGSSTAVLEYLILEQ